MSLHATFNDRENDNFTLTVSDTITNITEIELSMPTLGTGDYVTFSRFRNTREQAAILVKFDDGTQFDDAAIMNDIPDWCALSELLGFSSGVPAAIVSDEYGGFTILDNHYEVVPLTTNVVCPNSTVDDSTLHVYANLLAMLDDVDLGEQTGLQFQQVGDKIEIKVRANADAGGTRLVVYAVGCARIIETGHGLVII